MSYDPKASRPDTDETEEDAPVDRLLGADLENPDFVALAKSFGVMAMKADSPEELRGKLAEALDANEPVVIEVSIPRGSDSSPWPFIHPATLS